MNEIADGHLKAKPGVVITDVERARVRERAKEFHMPCFFVDPHEYPSKNEFDGQIISLLKSYETDLVVAAGYLRILSALFVDRYRNRIINIHPSLLPSFPGRQSQKKALEHGVKITGCTAHFIDEGVDTGPIILQSPVPILEGDTLNTLSARIMEEEFRVLPQSIKYFCEDKLEVVSRKVVLKS